MSSLARQNTLFVSEDWTRIYTALENIDFRAYDFDNLVQALFRYLQANYPESYNDWIASSEFITKVEILAWLSQNIAFRVDLNTRENFIATAERRDSLIRLAQNIGYRANRVRSSNGVLKLKTIRTTQDIIDSNGVNLRNKTITWNDPRDEDWFERFVLILNSSFATRTQFGFPLSQFSGDGQQISNYVFNSAAPLSGSYRFTTAVNGVSLPFDLYNARLDGVSGLINEIAPNPNNAFNLFYFLDGRGFNSDRTGFFLPFKQGNLTFRDDVFADPIPVRVFTLPATNVNNDDFFVQRIDETGGVAENWTQVDTTFGESVSFNTFANNVQSIYELDSLTNDAVRIRFGDGSFGRMPVGRFRFWYRTANPTPSAIRPSAVQNQSVTIPYSNGGNLFQLSMTLSLETTVTNGVITESNFDIRTRAGKVFYTQNRMVTAQDYNNFFLKDNSIRKIKTVNRTFSGQSRYARLTDPTGLYQNIKHVAEDGRIYQNTTTTINQYTADTGVLPIQSLISLYVNPIFLKSDKRILYFNSYTEVVLPSGYVWSETSRIADQSRGNVKRGAIIQTVGSTGIAPLSYIDADAVVRFDTPIGDTVVVDRVIDAGINPDGVIFKTLAPNGASVFSVFPAFRNRLTDDEQIELENRLINRLDFAMSWNQTTLVWDFIQSDDIDRTSSFSLSKQGDSTGAAEDASWMVMFVFVPNDPLDLWTITDRGLSIFFESAREVDFIFSNTGSIIDPETGRSVQDSISILESNESRDSLRRRGLEFLGQGSCDLSAYTMEAPGGQTCFKTSQISLNAVTTVVLLDGLYQVSDVDYHIVSDITGDSVCFFMAPPAGAQIVIYFSSKFVNAIQTITTITGDGLTEEFSLGVPPEVNTNNVISFIDGVMQHSNLDFGISVLGSDASIVFNEVLSVSASAAIYTISGIDNSVLQKSSQFGDGTTSAFTIVSPNQTRQTVMVTLDGIMQSHFQYTVVGDDTESIITFTTAPALGVRIRIISVTNTAQTKTTSYVFSGTGSQSTFLLTNDHSIPILAPGLIVTLDGILQDGPWSASPTWSITGGNTVLFISTPPLGTTVRVFHIVGSSGVQVNTLPITVPSISTSPNPPLTIESCLLSFLGEPVVLTPNDVIRHADGYVNKNGLAVSPIDSNLDGIFDSPFTFRDLVIQDGTTDLVLWRRIQEFGFDVWDPINFYTVPKGTYGSSYKGLNIAVGDAFDHNIVVSGSIHYDTFTKTWLISDAASGTWILADQTAYQTMIGRDYLSFIWTHYAPDANRIDPSHSNIMNVYILTSGYDAAFRTWLDQNGVEADRPIPETSDQLRLQYADFEEFKPISDAIIFYPGRYKPLFGNQAVVELQSVFKIIQTPGSTLSESDLKLRVLAAIRIYFETDRWEFGERFYFTELVAFIHAQLAPDLQSMVVVPRNNNQAFGRLFQVRAEPDELFVSSAGPDDIQVVQFFTDEELRIGVLA